MLVTSFVILVMWRCLRPGFQTKSRFKDCKDSGVHFHTCNPFYWNSASIAVSSNYCSFFKILPDQKNKLSIPVRNAWSKFYSAEMWVVGSFLEIWLTEWIFESNGILGKNWFSEMLKNSQINPELKSAIKGAFFDFGWIGLACLGSMGK